MGTTSNDIAAQRAMIERGEEKRRAARQAEERQQLRDTFAAAALTGLLSLNRPGPNQQFPTELCERTFRWADAMLRERDKQSVGEAEMDSVADRKSVATPRACARSCSQPFDSAPTTHDASRTGQSAADTPPQSRAGKNGAETVQEVEKCTERENDHDAVPEARAESDEARTDKAATSHRRDGTGDTPSDAEIDDAMLRERERKVDFPAPENAVEVESPATLPPVSEWPSHIKPRTNHDAVPEAIANADGEPAPKCGGEAGLSSRDGTGNTPSKAEIDALEFVVEEGRIGNYGILRSWLIRLRPEWESQSYEESDEKRVNTNTNRDTAQGECSVRFEGTETLGERMVQRVLITQAMLDDNEVLRAEIERLREAIRRLAEQDATLSVQGGNVTVTMDATLTDEEREAVELSISKRLDMDAIYTLRKLLERLS